jgi:hypothetical protein
MMWFYFRPAAQVLIGTGDMPSAAITLPV